MQITRVSTHRSSPGRHENNGEIQRTHLVRTRSTVMRCIHGYSADGQSRRKAWIWCVGRYVIGAYVVELVFERGQLLQK